MISSEVSRFDSGTVYMWGTTIKCLSLCNIGNTELMLKNQISGHQPEYGHKIKLFSTDRDEYLWDVEDTSFYAVVKKSLKETGSYLNLRSIK